jgi:large subunit ribosomal protein L21
VRFRVRHRCGVLSPRGSAPWIGKEQDVYAIVKTGGKQHKVAVGDLLEVERGLGSVGTQVSLPAVLLVEDGAVTTDAAALANVNVTAEIVAETKGPKIRIIKYKNKSGYRKRQGHRQHLLQVKVTDIQKGAS